MADYHISKDGDEWKVLKAGGAKASARTATKAEAPEIAKRLAEKLGRWRS